MNNFIPESHIIRHFPSKADSCFFTVGYDDFCVVKPIYAFRVQNFYTWHFVLSGKGTLQMCGRTYDIKSEQMFFIPPDTEMRYFPKPDEPWEYVWFALNGDTARQYGALLQFSLEEPIRESEYFPKIKYALKKLFDALKEDGDGYFRTLASFYEIMDICTSHSPRTGIHGVKKYIDESFAMPAFSIDSLCRDVGISHAHLLRLFRETYGTTVIQYVIKKRIELACEILLTTDLSVKSVAFSCGFSDEFHFMKTFKNEMGMSALQYRKAHKQK